MNFELRFPGRTVPLHLGQPLEQAITAFGDLQTEEIADEDPISPERRAFCVVDEGAELLFLEERLWAVFLHLTQKPGSSGVFRGSTDLLSKEIIDAKDDRAFAEVLEAKGFWPPKREYPFSVDRLNEDFRVRLENRRGEIMIVIDDGAMIR